MKTKTMLFATVALAAAVASPALAQTTDWTQQRRFQNPSDAFAYSNGVRENGRRAGNRSLNVYDTRGQYIGSDPDPTVRDQLARDPSQGD